MFNKPYKDNIGLYEENEYESEEYQSIYAWNKIDNLISRDKAIYYMQRFKDNLMSEIFKDKHKIDDEEIKDKEQKQNDKALYEIKILENKNFANKTTTKDTNKNINPNIEIMQSFKENDNKLLSNKRRKPSFDSPNEKNNENSLNRKEDKVKFKTKKPKKKKKDSSLASDIASFHTLFNKYFKYRVEKGKFFNVKYFNNKVGSNGYYLNKKLTQDKLGAENHSKKLDQKITEFIKDNKLERLKKETNKENLKILEFTVKQLIDEFRDYIFENSLYFKENETIKEINDNFVRIRKYPLIDFEKKEFGYYKYFSF
jgi:hypothetical protein